MRKVTLEWLEKHNACSNGTEHYKTLSTTDARELIHSCLSKSRFDWAVWLLVKLMSSKQRLSFAIYSAEKVLPIYEKENPGDVRPSHAIQAAKQVLHRNTKQARAASYANAAALAESFAVVSTNYAGSANADLKQDIVNHGLQLIGFSKD